MSDYLDGQLLIAMPSMSDPRFERAVIYICAHSADGAMGIVVNHISPTLDFPNLLKQLEISPDINDVQIDPKLNSNDVSVFLGGPVETGRGFVLHSPDYFITDCTLPIDENIYLTATVDILKALAEGSGPKQALLALGYAGWSSGQLEEEIQDNGWLNCPADSDLVFCNDASKKYDKAFEKIGVNPYFLVNQTGHA